MSKSWTNLILSLFLFRFFLLFGLMWSTSYRISNDTKESRPVHNIRILCICFSPSPSKFQATSWDLTTTSKSSPNKFYKVNSSNPRTLQNFADAKETKTLIVLPTWYLLFWWSSNNFTDDKDHGRWLESWFDALPLRNQAGWPCLRRGGDWYVV